MKVKLVGKKRDSETDDCREQNGKVGRNNVLQTVREGTITVGKV